MGIQRSNGSGSYVPDEQNLREDFYEANFTDVHLSSKEFEGDETEYTYLIFEVENDGGDMYEVSHRVTSKLSFNPDYGKNSTLCDELKNIGMWETACRVTEEITGVEGLAQEMIDGEASYVVDGEEDYDIFEDIMEVLFADQTFRVLIETYVIEVSESMSNESDDHEAGDVVNRASIEKLSEVMD